MEIDSSQPGIQLDNEDKAQHIMPCTKLTKPLEIYMSPGQMGEEAWPDPPTR